MNNVDAIGEVRMRPIRKALVVDDDDDLLHLCRVSLRAYSGWTVEVAQSVEAAIEAARAELPDVILLDMMMPGGGGPSLLRMLKSSDRTATIPVVLMSGIAAGPEEVQRHGAAGLIPKPFDPAELPDRVAQILGAEELTFDEILGESDAMRRLRALVARAAASDASVLVTGESGTGKELVARALHRAGKRVDGPFVAMNCAAVPEALLESELFGHVRGAFTDAKSTRRGLLLEADGGTLFLDEIGDLSPSLQPKLLRALQERTVRPIGGQAELPFDARLIAATNEDLASAVASRRFRGDLYYRINVITIEVPPLRERGDDVILLAHHFACLYAKRHGRQVPFLSTAALERLGAYAWPGNVRELQNTIERAMALGNGDEIGEGDLPKPVLPEGAPSPAGEERGVAPNVPAELLPLSEVERRYILHVLGVVEGNERLAARTLGIDQRTLRRKLEAYEAQIGKPPRR
jgi:two-component system response regulator HydG